MIFLAVWNLESAGICTSYLQVYLDMEVHLELIWESLYYWLITPSASRARYTFSGCSKNHFTVILASLLSGRRLRKSMAFIKSSWFFMVTRARFRAVRTTR